MATGDQDTRLDDPDFVERIKALTGFTDDQLELTWHAMVGHIESQPDELKRLLLETLD
jgi:hypothetical protein